MVRTLDKTHTILSYIEGSLKNVMIVEGENKYQGFIFSLLNPPVPLGGNIVSVDIYVNASALSEYRPIPFKPFQSARFLIIKEDGLEEKKKHKIVILSKLEGFEQILIPFTFSDYAGEQRERIFLSSNLVDDQESATTSEDIVFKNFTNPLILSGKKAYIVCSSNGSLSANWTWMGARYDNGGLYVPPVRAFGRITIEISMDDGIRKRLPNFVVSSRHEKGFLSTRHEVAGLQVKRKLFVPVENRGFVMRLELDLLDKHSDFSKIGLKKKIQKNKRKIRVHFLIDGNITSYGLAAISQSNYSKLLTTDNCLQIQTSAKKGVAHYYGTIGVAPRDLRPSKILTDSFDNDLELSYDLEIEAGKSCEISLVGAGSFSSSRDCIKEYRFIRDNYRQLLEDTREHFITVFSSTLSAESISKQNPTIAKLLKALDKAKVS